MKKYINKLIFLQKTNLTQKLNESLNENQNLKTNLDEIITLSHKQSDELKRLHESAESFKKQNEDRIQEEKTKIEMEVRIKDEVYNKHKRNIYGMVYSNIIDKLTAFLNPIELLKLKSTSKIIYYSIDNNLLVNKQLLKNFAKMKNDAISKIINYDMKHDYEISDFVMEKLIKE